MIKETYNEIKEWFEITVPNPDKKNIETQLKCIKEEVDEYHCSIDNAGELDGLCGIIVTCIGLAHMRGLEIAPYNPNNVDYRNSILQTIVEIGRNVEDINDLGLSINLNYMVSVCLGIGFEEGYKMFEALKEVNRSNFSKFEDGKPIFDENGKVTKGVEKFS